MRALVTGSAGFIGTTLCERLAGLGHDVVGLDRRPATGPGRHLQVDLAHPVSARTIRDLAADADVIFHLAARAGVRSDEPGIEALRHRDIVVATDRLLSVVPGDVRLVVASSSSVYGGAVRRDGHTRPSAEGDPLLPRGGYARAKTVMEAHCRDWARRGRDLLVVRPFTVVGEGQRPDMAVSRWLDAARAGRPLKIFGSLERTRDVTEALVHLADGDHRGTVNLGTGRPRTLEEITEAVFTAVGRRTGVEVQPALDEEVHDTHADTTRARSLGVVLDTDLVDLVRRQHAHRHHGAAVA